MGSFMAVTTKIRQIDIASKARVTPATVSKVLSGMPNSRIGQETRKRVLAACRALNFDASAKLRQRTAIFGVFKVDYITHFFFSELFAAITRHLGYSGIGLLPKSTNTRYPKTDSLAYLTRQNLPKEAEAVIIIDQLFPDEEIIRLSRQGIPLILIDRYIDHPDIPCILIDTEYAVYTLTKHLIAAGHRNICCLLSTRSWDSQRRMLAGYASAMIKSGLRFREENAFEVGLEHLPMERDEIGKYRRCLMELDNGILAMKDRPTAVITAHDTMAIPLMELAESKGLKIPEDLAVSGFDNTPMSKVCRPVLTSVDLPFDEIGARTAGMLKALISKKKVEQRVVKLKPRIILRKSTEVIAAGSPLR